MGKQAPTAQEIAKENGWLLQQDGNGNWYAKIGSRAAYASDPDRALVVLLNQHRGGEVRYGGLLLPPRTVASYLTTRIHPVVQPDREPPPIAESADEPPAEADAQPPAPEPTEE